MSANLCLALQCAAVGWLPGAPTVGARRHARLLFLWRKKKGSAGGSMVPVGGPGGGGDAWRGAGVLPTWRTAGSRWRARRESPTRFTLPGEAWPSAWHDGTGGGGKPMRMAHWGVLALCSIASLGDAASILEGCGKCGNARRARLKRRRGAHILLCRVGSGGSLLPGGHNLHTVCTTLRTQGHGSKPRPRGRSKRGEARGFFANTL